MAHTSLYLRPHPSAHAVLLESRTTRTHSQSHSLRSSCLSLLQLELVLRRKHHPRARGALFHHYRPSVCCPRSSGQQLHGIKVYPLQIYCRPLIHVHSRRFWVPLPHCRVDGGAGKLYVSCVQKAHHSHRVSMGRTHDRSATLSGAHNRHLNVRR